MWIPFLIVVIILIFVFRSMGTSNNTYTNQGYMAALERGDVVSVTVKQSRTVPTGTLEFTLRDGNTGTLSVSDVNAAQEVLADYEDVIVTVTAVTEQDLFTSVALPVIVGVLVIMIGMVLVISRMMGASSNSKMMNFGKSRARLAEDTKDINLSKVAGLEEEKDEVK